MSNIPTNLSVFILSDNYLKGSLIREFLSNYTTYTVYLSSSLNDFDNQDVLLVITDNKEMVGSCLVIKAFKVLLTSNITKDILSRAILSGFKIVYDNNIDIKRLLSIGLHFYIYRGVSTPNYNIFNKLLFGPKDISKSLLESDL